MTDLDRAQDALDSALRAAWLEGRTIPCTASPKLWLSEDEAERATAGLLCGDCPLLVECHAVAVAGSAEFGVYGGEDFTVIPGRACEQCGELAVHGPRAKLCPSCRQLARAERVGGGPTDPTDRLPRVRELVGRGMPPEQIADELDTTPEALDIWLRRRGERDLVAQFRPVIKVRRRRRGSR